ncbi:sodium:proton antiporter [Saccharomonospora viridis]|jgi:multicomponent Na+:H+ antiporter subunit C|uniref:Multisubunit Na+/H+ antiporter, MnhC subunit n=2 Tax=Saccharomonospora viridis TaxID=1852 RepID=C7MXT3_SACVD|nr:NADH-quinone oxidoreductase subunit K [Saccharomonospora viridis]ACU98011.1 multisubunit Na+/H+ antiporter, MnhC subunit [Saccharomonospora viridis DSM 43017]KHF45988.1 sodium:proton antiporter [Saccharomonospora viridis]SFP38049.1 multicomponent Na+:H+ antiporter subunit C [Saccharomonospora viridis]
MNLAIAGTAALLFGSGAYLLLQHELVRVTAGIVLISQSAVLMIIGSSLFRGKAPLVPTDDQVADPLPQALALTALVIGLATVALLLALMNRVTTVFRSARRNELITSETAYERALADQRRLDRDEAT